MISVAVIAFLCEMVNTYFMQLGFILQKLAHRHVESLQKRNLVSVVQQKPADENKNTAASDNFVMADDACSSNPADVVIEQDRDNSMRVYCSWRFLLGLMLMVCCLCFHVYLIQYLDLTLISANSANSIVAVLVLSTAILGEQFIWRYDFTALFFISAGCASLVLNANTSEQTEYTADEVKALLSTPRTLIFITFCMCCILLSLILLRFVLQRLRRFESDVELY